MTDDDHSLELPPGDHGGGGNHCHSEKRLRELAHAAVSAGVDLDSKIQTFLNLGCDGLRLETGVFAGIDNDVFHIVQAVSPAGPAPVDLDGGLRDTLCNETRSHDGALAIERVGKSTYRTHPDYTRAQIEAYIGAVVPVSGSQYGVVYFSSATPRLEEFTESDREYVRLMALWIGSEIEPRQSLHKPDNSSDSRSAALVSKARREALLSDVGLALRTTLDSDEIERLATNGLATVLSADRCFFVHFDLERDEMRFSNETRGPALESIAGEYKPSSLGIEIQSLYEDGQTLIVEDAVLEPWPQRALESFDAWKLRSWIAVPLFYGGRLEAAVCVAMETPRVWTDDEVALVEAVAAQTRTSIEAVALIRRERRIATTLQEALLPPVPDILPGMLLAHEYRAALDEASVGGDFYAVYPLEDGCYALVIGDVSGKGLAAASQVAGLQNMLRYALCASHGLSEALSQLNAIVAAHELLAGFATLFVGIYDTDRRSLKYCNCGHEPPLILRNGDVQPLITTGPPIGAVPSVSYKEAVIQLELGDVFILYTDGLSEAGTDRRVLLGHEGLAEILRRRGDEGEMHELASQIMSDVAGFANGRLRDDACLVVVRLADTSELDVDTAMQWSAPAVQAMAAGVETARETPMEEQFRLMVDCVTDYAIFLLDTTGHVVTWNRGAERLKGYSASEIVGKHFSVFYTPEDVNRGHPLDELAIATADGRYEEEGWRVRKDGSRFWASVVVTAVRDSNGVLRGFGKVTRDFTERRRAEQQLRRSEERFRHLVVGVRDYAIFMLNPDGTVVSWNDGAERINGYSASEVLGKHFSIFYTHYDVERNHPAQELAMAAADGSYEEEGWRIRKDGTKFWASVVITALKDEHGELYGYAKVTRDITEKRAAEEAHRKNLRDEISRSFLRDILYSVTEGRLRFCEDEGQLPDHMDCIITDQVLDGQGLAGLRKCTRDAAAALRFPVDREADIVTAASEAAMNAMVHANNAKYSVCRNDTTIQIWISDRGTGIELTKLHRATLERGFTTENSLGHGFWLMLHTCDRLWLRSTSTGTTVVMEQDVTLPEPEWLSRPRDLSDYLILNK